MQGGILKFPVYAPEGGLYAFEGLRVCTAEQPGDTGLCSLKLLSGGRPDETLDVVNDVPCGDAVHWAERFGDGR